MRYFFYNSFTLGSGYRYAELRENVLTSTSIPLDIDCDFCNGGCQLVVRKTKSDTSILVVKGILYVNDQKKFDEQGRKVYINFAIEASGNELGVLNNIFFAMMSEWDHLCRYMGESIKIPYPAGTYGYGIDQECMEALVRFFSAYDSGRIQHALGIDKRNLNAIVLKSSDYSYYESLAKDLYKSKKQAFGGYFVSDNVVAGETFSDLKMKFSVYTYEDFVKAINNGRGSADYQKTVEEPRLEETESQERQNPEPIVSAPEPVLAETCDRRTGDEESGQTMDDKSENTKSVFARICYKAYKLIKSYSGFILGFACGLLVGYMIWKF